MVPNLSFQLQIKDNRKNPSISLLVDQKIETLTYFEQLKEEQNDHFIILPLIN